MENREMENSVVEKPSLIGMIMNPTVQFERIRENPKILVAILIVTFLTVIGMLMMSSGMELPTDDPELAGMSEEELMVIAMISQVSFVIVGLFTPIFTIFISTVVLLIIAKIVRSEVSFKQLFSMNTYIYMISALGILLNGLIFMILQVGDPEVYITSLNSIVHAEGVLGEFLGIVEVFSIWSLIITGIGLQVVAKFSKGLSWSIVVAFFIVGAVFAMVSAALGSAFGV